MSETVNALARLRKPASELARAVLVPYAIHRALLSLVAVFATQFIPQDRGFHVDPYVPVLDVWFRWDSVYYLMIADAGYTESAFADQSTFFPAYPALVGLFDLLLPLPVAAFLVSQLAALVALSFLYRWVESLEGEDTARHATLLAILFPTSYFLSAVYPVGTYLAFAIGAVFAARRGRSWLAALLVFAACLARPQGFVCLTFPFVIHWLVRSRKWPELPLWVAGSIPALGVLVLAHYAYTGDPLGFLGRGVTYMPLFWEEPSDPPPFWAVLWDEGIGPSLMKRLLNWSALALLVASAVHLLRKKQVDLALLTLGTVALPLVLFGQIFDIASMARYALGAFPVFLVMARWLERRGRAPVHWAMTMLQTVLFSLFASWYWVE